MRLDVLLLVVRSLHRLARAREREHFSRSRPRPPKLLALGRAEGVRNCEKSMRPIPTTTMRVLVLAEATKFSREGGPMEKKWRVSDVELLEGGLLFGFALYDQKGTAVRFVRIPDRSQS